MMFLYEQNKEHWGSTVARGFCIAQALNVPCLAIEAVADDLHGETLVCLKFSDYSRLLGLSQRNRIVIDMADCGQSVESQSSIFEHFGFGIFTSHQQRRRLGGLFRESDQNVTIYHHWDARLNSVVLDPHREARIAYFGLDAKCNLFKQSNRIDYFNVTESSRIRNMRHGMSFRDSLALYAPYNVHFVVKPREHEMLLQPMTKVANAAALGCPVICFQHEQYEELLTSEYPYFCPDFTLGSLDEVIEKIRATYQGQAWFQALGIMRKVRAETSLASAVKQYQCLEVP